MVLRVSLDKHVRTREDHTFGTNRHFGNRLVSTALNEKTLFRVRPCLKCGITELNLGMVNEAIDEQ